MSQYYNPEQNPQGNWQQPLQGNWQQPQQGNLQPTSSAKAPFNVFGLIGFILSLLNLIIGWANGYVAAILFVAGLVFSILGVFKPKKALAVTGIVLSGLFLLIVLIMILFIRSMADFLGF